MRKLTNQKEYTETELMMFFALLTLFGTLCFTLIHVSSGAYNRFSENQEEKSFSPIELSYLENRVHLGDSIDCVKLVQHPNTQKTFETKKGICLNFAVLYVAMCRSQGISCKVTMEYYEDGEECHAWE